MKRVYIKKVEFSQCHKHITGYESNEIEPIRQKKFFLQNDLILRRYSYQVDCLNKEYDYFVIINSSTVIHRISNKSGAYNLIRPNTFTYIKVNGVLNEFARLNFNHFDLIKNPEDNEFLEPISTISEHDHYGISTLSEILEDTLNVKTVIQTIKDNWKAFKITMLISSVSIIALIIIILTICIIKKIKKISHTRRYQQVNLIEGFLDRPVINNVRIVRQNSNTRSKSVDAPRRNMDTTTEAYLNHLQTRASRGF